MTLHLSVPVSAVGSYTLSGAEGEPPSCRHKTLGPQVPQEVYTGAVHPSRSMFTFSHDRGVISRALGKLDQLQYGCVMPSDIGFYQTRYYIMVTDMLLKLLKGVISSQFLML